MNLNSISFRFSVKQRLWERNASLCIVLGQKENELKRKIAPGKNVGSNVTGPCLCPDRERSRYGGKPDPGLVGCWGSARPRAGGKHRRWKASSKIHHPSASLSPFQTSRCLSSEDSKELHFHVIYFFLRLHPVFSVLIQHHLISTFLHFQHWGCCPSPDK